MLDNLIIMRQEIMLIVIVLILLIAEIFLDKNRSRMVMIATFLFAVHTIVGFLPAKFGFIFGEMYKNTEMINFMKNILNVGVLVVLLQSAEWIKTSEALKNRATEFYIIMFSTLIGMFYMLSSGHFIMFYIGIELATIPLAALVAYDMYKAKSAEAGIKLILTSSVASGIMIFGLSMIYGSTGTMYYSEMPNILSVSPIIILALVFFLSGIAFKTAIVPFHFWAPDVYEGAPISVTSYLATISKASSVFILVILLFTVFKNLSDIWLPLFYGVSILTIMIGNFFAIRQKNLKRLLAFSGIVQAGFILLGILGGDAEGVTSVLYFMVIYIFTTLAIFGVLQAVYNQTGKEFRDDLKGLYRTNPKLSLIILLALFSLVGIPPVAGFFGKFFLIRAAASQGYYLLIFIAALNLIISLYYYMLIIKEMFLLKSDNPIKPFKSDWYMRFGLIINTIAILLLGMLSPVYEYVLELGKSLF